jgi:hypothetical protein
VVSGQWSVGCYWPPTTRRFGHEPKKAQAVQKHYRGQAPGTLARGFTSRGSTPPGPEKETAQAQEARAVGRDGTLLIAPKRVNPSSMIVLGQVNKGPIRWSRVICSPGHLIVRSPDCLQA